MEIFRANKITETTQEVKNRLTTHLKAVETSREYISGGIFDPSSGWARANGERANIMKRLDGIIPVEHKQAIDIVVFGKKRHTFPWFSRNRKIK